MKKKTKTLLAKRSVAIKVAELLAVSLTRQTWMTTTFRWCSLAAGFRCPLLYVLLRLRVMLYDLGRGTLCPLRCCCKLDSCRNAFVQPSTTHRYGRSPTGQQQISL